MTLCRSATGVAWRFTYLFTYLIHQASWLSKFSYGTIAVLIGRITNLARPSVYSFFCSERFRNTPFTRSSKHQAIIEQTSSKRRANIEQIEHRSCTCIVYVYFEYICLMFAWSCKRGITRKRKGALKSKFVRAYNMLAPGRDNLLVMLQMAQCSVATVVYNSV